MKDANLFKFLFFFLWNGFAFCGLLPSHDSYKKAERTITFEQKSAIPWQLEFHQISNIGLISDSRRRQKGIVWTYWKSTHKSYSWICNIPAQIANVALKYCLRSSSLDPVQDKLMNAPLLLRSTYLLQWYLHTFSLSVASGLSEVGSNEFKAGINIVNSNHGFPVCPRDCPQGRHPLLKQVIFPL